MLNNVDNSSGALVALADNGYAVSEMVELAENLSVNSVADVFESGYALLAGNRISIVVDGSLISTMLEEANIISEGPFQYDTSAITIGAIPSEVFFTGDLRIEVVDISMSCEFVNISTATDPDTLVINRAVSEDDNLVIVTSDDKIHKVSQLDIDIVGNVSTINTSSITSGDVPTKAYLANVPVSFNGIYATRDRARCETIVDSDNISVLITKKGVIVASNSIEARVDFISTGDKMISMNYNSSILLNDRHLAPEFALTRDFPDLDAYQSIIFNLN